MSSYNLTLELQNIESNHRSWDDPWWGLLRGETSHGSDSQANSVYRQSYRLRVETVVRCAGFARIW